jgi:hypothetical protein
MDSVRTVFSLRRISVFSFQVRDCLARIGMPTGRRLIIVISDYLPGSRLFSAKTKLSVDSVRTEFSLRRINAYTCLPGSRLFLTKTK